MRYTLVIRWSACLKCSDQEFSSSCSITESYLFSHLYEVEEEEEEWPFIDLSIILHNLVNTRLRRTSIVCPKRALIKMFARVASFSPPSFHSSTMDANYSL